MSTLLNAYYGTVTAGGTDGTQVSTLHSLTSPIQALLTVSASTGASIAIKCALRCNSGYITSGATTLSFKSYDNGNYVDYTGTDMYMAIDNGYVTTAVAGSVNHTVSGIVTNDIIALDGVSLIAGTQFAIGGTDAITLQNLAIALNANSTFNAKFTATASTNILTVIETVAGNGNTPTNMVITGSGLVINSSITTSVPDALSHATWGTTLSIASSINSTNTIFWIKLTSNAGTLPENIDVISIYIEDTVAATS